MSRCIVLAIPQSNYGGTFILQAVGMVKLPYGECHELIEDIEFVEGVKMKEVAKVLPSKMRDFILIKALPKSETGFVI